MNQLALLFLTPAIFLAVGLTLPNGFARSSMGPISLLGFLYWLLTCCDTLAPEHKLLYASLWLLYFIKGWAVLKVPREELQTYSPAGLLLYSYPWPGVDPGPFRERGSMDQSGARWFAFGFPTMCIGVAVGLVLAANLPALPSRVLGLAGVLAVLTTVHLGYSDILSGGFRLLGFPVERLFHFPLLSNSLRDFWSLRWNRPFVEMNRLLFRPIFSRVLSKGGAALALFVVSGLLHELALSFPAGGGWGGPLLYFFVQGCGFLLEKRYRIQSRFWVWMMVFLPMPLLFHGPFLETLVLPFYSYLHSLPALSSPYQLLATSLTGVAWGHFLVLAASFQVPHRLNWGEELQRLRPLNRKLLWTYGGYIATMIFLWGFLTLNLLPEFLAGEKSALALVGVIALFWWSRIVVDAFYFEHSDWPEGVEFVLGHTMLTSLFLTIAGTYTWLLCWHLT
jgi:membrane bound O-acyltransferase family protein